MGLGVLKI